MSHAEEIDRLEKIVEKLLESYQAMMLKHHSLIADIQLLKQDNGRLRQEVEVENSDLKRELESLRSDKTEMHSRVSGIISKIEAWEKGITMPTKSAEINETKQESITAEEQQANLFNADPEQQ